jgi:hypothetical protein
MSLNRVGNNSGQWRQVSRRLVFEKASKLPSLFPEAIRRCSFFCVLDQHASLRQYERMIARLGGAQSALALWRWLLGQRLHRG